MNTGFDSSSLKTDFLNLFVTQIQNQNPLEPMDQQDFLSQLAQFSVVEGITNMNSQLTKSIGGQQLAQGIDLVGKNITFQTADSEQMQVGLVDQVMIDHDGLLAHVNGQTIPIANISSVFAV